MYIKFLICNLYSPEDNQEIKKYTPVATAEKGNCFGHKTWNIVRLVYLFKIYIVRLLSIISLALFVVLSSLRQVLHMSQQCKAGWKHSFSENYALFTGALTCPCADIRLLFRNVCVYTSSENSTCIWLLLMYYRELIWLFEDQRQSRRWHCLNRLLHYRHSTVQNNTVMLTTRQI